ncbi:hypothetical protein RLOatenuis_7330 [Rickettsiales bacterium]|nr:hypothetical protein RLOatenuis_7330 [Rickettsiales bacterium]
MVAETLTFDQYLRRVARTVIQKGGAFLENEDGMSILYEPDCIERKDLKELAGYNVTDPANILPGTKKALEALNGDVKKPVSLGPETLVTLGGLAKGDLIDPADPDKIVNCDFCDPITFNKIFENATQITVEEQKLIRTIHKYHRILWIKLHASKGSPLIDAFWELIEDSRKVENYTDEQSTDQYKYAEELKKFVSFAELNDKEIRFLDDISKGEVREAYWLKGIVQKMVHSMTIMSLVLDEGEKSILHLVSQTAPWLQQIFASKDPTKLLRYKDCLSKNQEEAAIQMQELKENLLLVLNDFEIKRGITLVPAADKDEENPDKLNIANLHAESLIKLLFEISQYNKEEAKGQQEGEISCIGIGKFFSNQKGKLLYFPPKFLAGDNPPKLTDVSHNHKAHFPDSQPLPNVTRGGRADIIYNCPFPNSDPRSAFCGGGEVVADSSRGGLVPGKDDGITVKRSGRRPLGRSIEATDGPAASEQPDDSVDFSGDDASSLSSSVSASSSASSTPFSAMGIEYSADIGSRVSDLIKLCIEYFPYGVKETAIGTINVTHLEDLARLLESEKGKDIRRITIHDLQGPLCVHENVLRNLWNAVKNSNLEYFSIATKATVCTLLCNSFRGTRRIPPNKFFEELCKMSQNRQTEMTFDQALDLRGSKWSEYQEKMEKTIAKNQKQSPEAEFSKQITKNNPMHGPISNELAALRKGSNETKQHKACITEQRPQIQPAQTSSSNAPDDSFWNAYKTFEDTLIQCNLEDTPIKDKSQITVYEVFATLVGSQLEESASFNGHVLAPDKLREKARALSEDTMVKLRKEAGDLYCFFSGVVRDTHLDALNCSIPEPDSHQATINLLLYLRSINEEFMQSAYSAEVVEKSLDGSYKLLHRRAQNKQGGADLSRDSKLRIILLFSLSALQRLRFVVNILYETKQYGINEQQIKEFNILAEEAVSKYLDQLCNIKQHMTQDAVAQQQQPSPPEPTATAIQNARSFSSSCISEQPHHTSAAQSSVRELGISADACGQVAHVLSQHLFLAQKGVGPVYSLLSADSLAKLKSMEQKAWSGYLELQGQPQECPGTAQPPQQQRGNLSAESSRKQKQIAEDEKLAKKLQEEEARARQGQQQWGRPRSGSVVDASVVDVSSGKER